MTAVCLSQLRGVPLRPLSPCGSYGASDELVAGYGTVEWLSAIVIT